MKRTYIALTAAALLLAGCGSNDAPKMDKKDSPGQSSAADISSDGETSLFGGTELTENSSAAPTLTDGSENTVVFSDKDNKTSSAAALSGRNTQPDTFQNTQPNTVQNTQPDTFQNTQPDTFQYTQPNTVQNPQPDAVQNPQPDTFQNPQPDTFQNTQPNTAQNTQPNAVQNTRPDNFQNTAQDPGQPNIYEEPSQPAAVTEPDTFTFTPEAPDNQSPANDEPPAEGNYSKQIAVNNISQYPELPTGCETTALTMLLNYYGIGADKLDIARNYLPKQAFYWQDGLMYGADFHTTFAGDPEDENSYGCYAPCIVTAANSYLSAWGSWYSARDISGESLDTLLSSYIDNDTPVLIWITYGDLHEPSYTTIWNTPDGGQVQWYSWEHCVVLTGYDRARGIVYVSDPIAGNTYYDMELLNVRYEQFGRQCVGLF